MVRQNVPPSVIDTVHLPSPVLQGPQPPEGGRSTGVPALRHAAVVPHAWGEGHGDVYEAQQGAGLHHTQHW